MIRAASILLLTVSLGACASTGQGNGVSTPEGAQALRLAEALSSAAGSNDPVLGTVVPEMTALEAALSRPPAPMAGPEMDSGESAAAALVPAPDLSSATPVMSLMHAIHLASYREARHVAEGWHALQGQHPELSGLQARYVEVDLGGQGVYLRLLAGPFDTEADATQACLAVRARQDWCAVTPFDGIAVLP